MDLVVVFALFVFMLVLLCFCVATGFSVNKDLYRVVAAMAATRFAAGALRVVFLIDYKRGSNRRLAEGARYEPRISWPCLHGVVWRREALICRPAVRTVTPPSETVVVVGRFVYLCCSLGWDDSFTSCTEMPVGVILYTVSQKTSTFLFLNNSVKKLTDFNNFPYF